MIRSTIRQYLILTGLHKFGVGFISAVYATFLISKGMSLFEVGLVNFFFFATLFVFEIPTGAFADVFGRKASYVLSCFLYATGMLVYSVSDSFAEFVVAEMISAVGATFASGAFKAWFVDTLTHHGYEGKLHGIFAREHQVTGVVGVLGALVGATLFDVSPGLPWMSAGCIILSVGILALLSMKEEYFVRQPFSWRAGYLSLKGVTVSSFRYGLDNKAIRFILVLSAAQYVAVQAPNMQWQPLFRSFVSHQTGLGFLWAGMQIALVVGAVLAPWFLARVRDEKKALVMIQIAIGAGVAGAALFDSFPIAVLLFVLHEIPRGMFRPIAEAYLHDNIPSKERATIGSFESVAHHAGGMIGLLLSGIAAETFGIRPSWIGFGLFLVLTTLLVGKNGKGK